MGGIIAAQREEQTGALCVEVVWIVELLHQHSSLSPPLFSIFLRSFLLILHTAAQSGCCATTSSELIPVRRARERKFIEHDPRRRASQLSRHSGHGLLDPKSHTKQKTLPLFHSWCTPCVILSKTAVFFFRGEQIKSNQI
jgi:hypothetical protein